MWVVVLVAVLALAIGGVVGGVIGFGIGVGSQLMDLVPGSVEPLGDDAFSGGAPADAARIAVGPFLVTELDVQQDFAGDFTARLTLTNDGASFQGGAIEVEFFAGARRLGQVSGPVPELQTSESVELELWGFDDYEGSVDRVEVRIG